MTYNKVQKLTETCWIKGHVPGDKWALHWLQNSEQTSQNTNSSNP